MEQSEKNSNELENLKLEKKKFEKIKNGIENSKKTIKEKIDSSREKISLAKNDLRDAFANFYSEIRNPMLINNEFKKKLINFESNLNNLKIPESVGRAFFDDLIKSNSCLCGHEMSDDMRENILKSKESILSEDTWLILSVLKHKIRRESEKETLNLGNLLTEIAEKKGKLSIEERKGNEIVDGIDDKKYQDTIKRLNKIEERINELEIFFKKYYEAPKKTDTPDADSINKISNLLKITNDKIAEATATENISKKITLLKKILKQTQEQSLDFITSDLVEKINKEIPRVMPFEKIFVKDIKNRIVLDDREQASAGQQARIGYLFLIKLLDRPNLNFPFIVDSPVTALDDISRSEIANTIASHLNNQYIGLILPKEREDFVNILEQKTNDKVHLIVAFNTIDQETDKLVNLALEYNVKKDPDQNFIVSNGNKEFFWNFKTNLIVQN